MTGQRILLVARDGLVVHAGKEIIRLIILAHMIEAEVPVLARIGPALWRAMCTLVLAVGPFAQLRGFARLRLLLRGRLVGLDANGVEEFG